MAVTGKLYSIKDAHVYSGSSNYNLSYVACGKSSDQAYGFFAFAAHGIPSGSRITKATFYGWVYSATYSNTFGLTCRPAGGPWSETGITGNNKPTSTGVSCIVNVGAKDTMFAQDITPIVQAWFGNPNFDYAWGMYLTNSTTNSLKNIRSRTTAVSEKKPYIIIEYDDVRIEPTGDLTIGTEATINVTTPDDGATYTAHYSIGGASGDLGSCTAGTTTALSWTPALALANEITSAESGTVQLIVKRDGVLMSALPFDLLVPASMVPSISAASYAAVNPTGDTIGVHVQGRSATKATVTASSVYGATIASYELMIAGKTYTSTTNEVTSDALAQSGTLSTTVKVTDTRGRTASLTGSVTVYPYFEPIITDIALARALSDGTETNDGKYIKAKLACRLAALNDLNTRELTLRIKPGDGSYGAAISVTLPAGYDFSVTAIIGGGTIGAGAYEVQATLADRYADIVEVAALSSAQRWLTLKANGDTEFHGDVRIDEDHRASFLGMLMPLCLLSSPTAEDLVYNSTFRWWLFDWKTIRKNGAFATFKGGVSSARDVGVVIPADGFYRLHFNINLEKASSDSAMGVAILRMPPKWKPPTEVNYMIESDISTRLDRYWRLFKSWSATNTFGAVSGVMWCNEGDKVLPTAYTVNVSKTVNSLLTSFSVQRVG